MNNQPTKHLFASTSAAYDASQTRDDIRDGDVLIVRAERVVGILVAAWPTSISVQTHGAFHTLAEGSTWTRIGDVDRDYSASHAVALEAMHELAHVDDRVRLRALPDSVGTVFDHGVVEGEPVAFVRMDGSGNVALTYDRFDVIDDTPEGYGDDRDLCDHFPEWSRVVVRHSFSDKPIGAGFVIGYVESLIDTGSPESGPGPLEIADLVRVMLDDGDRVVDADPSNIEPE